MYRLKKILSTWCLALGFLEISEAWENCDDVKRSKRVSEQGYHVRPPIFYGTMVFVYCKDLTSSPKMFVTLNKSNFGSTDTPSSECNFGPSQEGTTYFTKIRVDMRSFKVVPEDYTFLLRSSRRKHPYGQAYDCATDHTKSECETTTSSFVIDTRGTDFIVEPRQRWIRANDNSYVDVLVTNGGATITIKCGGHCGGCVPEDGLQLVPVVMNGGWGTWTESRSYQCSVSCEGSGLRLIEFRRLCNRPKPKSGGRQCYGTNHKSVKVECDRPRLCPIDGGWNSWERWAVTECSVTCGGPGVLSVTFQRYCTRPQPQHEGKPCEGDDFKNGTEECKPKSRCGGRSGERKDDFGGEAVVIAAAFLLMSSAGITGIILYFQKRKEIMQQQNQDKTTKSTKPNANANAWENRAFVHYSDA